MRWWTTAIVLALVGMLTRTVDIEAAEKFQKLTGAQIQAKFAGMEMSDEVHWRDRYERNGTVTSQSMGKNRFGKWRVEKTSSASISIRIKAAATKSGLRERKSSSGVRVLMAPSRKARFRNLPAAGRGLRLRRMSPQASNHSRSAAPQNWRGCDQ